MFIFCWCRRTEGENLGVEATGAWVFLKLSSLFVKIHRWVLVRISLNCKLSGLNGRLPNCSKLKKAKEPLRGPNSIKKWRRKLLFFFCLLVSIVLKELLDQSCGLPLIQLIIFQSLDKELEFKSCLHKKLIDILA